MTNPTQPTGTPKKSVSDPKTRGNVGGRDYREEGRDSDEDPNTRDVSQGHPAPRPSR